MREDTPEPIAHFISLNRFHEVIVQEPNPSDLQAKNKLSTN